MLDLLSHMNDKDKQVCNYISISVWEYFLSKTSLQVLGSTNAELLLDSGFKLSDIIVTLCSKLLDYILLKSGSEY